jgi:hypothetical protein
MITYTSVSFEAPISEIEGPQTYALDRTSTGVEKHHNSLLKIHTSMQKELIENYLLYGHILSKSFARRGV